MEHFRTIVKWIESEAGLTLGTNLFADYLPQDAPETYYLLLDQAGGDIVVSLPDRADMRINLICSAPEAYDARTNAQTVYDLLHVRIDQDTPIVNTEDYTVMVGHAESTPQYAGLDYRRNHSFLTTYTFKLREKE